MNKFLLFLFLGIGMAGASQSVVTESGSQKHRKIIITDTMVKNIQHLQDSMREGIRIDDSIQIRSNLSDGLKSLIRVQKENESRQRKSSILRIAFGVFMLAILIIGLTRKKKKVK